jgi:hypothetical protein
MKVVYLRSIYLGQSINNRLISSLDFFYCLRVVR